MLGLCVCNLEFLSAICSFLGKHSDASSGAADARVREPGAHLSPEELIFTRFMPKPVRI